MVVRTCLMHLTINMGCAARAGLIQSRLKHIDTKTYRHNGTEIKGHKETLAQRNLERV